MNRSNNPWIATASMGQASVTSVIQLLLMGYGVYCLIKDVTGLLPRLFARTSKSPPRMPVHDEGGE